MGRYPVSPRYVMQRMVDSGRGCENSFSMARLLFMLAVIAGLGCGDDGATVIGGGGAPSGSDGGSGGDVAQAGAPGSPEPGSDVVSVGDGEFSSGEPPPTVGAEMTLHVPADQAHLFDAQGLAFERV